MARTVRNAKIDTRSARSKLAIRREPYWTVVSAGCAIGYRRGRNSGTWIARFRDHAGKQHYEALGTADDALEPDDIDVFSYALAQKRAREMFARLARETSGNAPKQNGPYTVANALDDYFEAQRRKGAKGEAKDRKVADARIAPELGSIEVQRLTSQQLRRWHQELANKPKLVRTKAKAEERAVRAVDADDPDAARSRRATANRVLTILKAALNLAFHDGRAPSDEPWRKVKPFKSVDVARVRFLNADECQRLVKACTGRFGDLVRAALLTGCRYGELCRLTVADVNLAAGTLTVREAKGGKPRHVVLTNEGRAFFKAMADGRPTSALVFERDTGAPWKASQQARPIADASETAKIEPPATFHVLRHTHGSMLAMAGTPMGVIAKQLGHADTRITERHYAHLAPNYVADTIRSHFPSLGIAKGKRAAGARRVA